MRRWRIVVREATVADVRACESAPEHLEWSEDGRAAVFVDGDLIAVSDEYGTAYLCGDLASATPTKEAVEAFLNAAMEFYAAGL